jgi:hypothetical protein
MSPVTDRTQPRPPLAEDAGKNSIRLDLALTRDELSLTVEQLKAKLSPRRLRTDRSGKVFTFVLARIAKMGRKSAGKGGGRRRHV